MTVIAEEKGSAMDKSNSDDRSKQKNESVTDSSSTTKDYDDLSLQSANVKESVIDSSSTYDDLFIQEASVIKDFNEAVKSTEMNPDEVVLNEYKDLKAAHAGDRRFVYRPWPKVSFRLKSKQSKLQNESVIDSSSSTTKDHDDLSLQSASVIKDFNEAVKSIDLSPEMNPAEVLNEYKDLNAAHAGDRRFVYRPWPKISFKLKSRQSKMRKDFNVFG